MGKEMDKQDLQGFISFVKSLSVPELVVLQHDLRQAGDEGYLQIVMSELKRRNNENNQTNT